VSNIEELIAAYDNAVEQQKALMKPFSFPKTAESKSAFIASTTTWYSAKSGHIASLTVRPFLFSCS
jgi:hypothetical protein